MANPVVNCEVKEGVGVITLQRPEKRNAINQEVLEGLQKAFSDLSENVAVKIILLQGAGAVFSAGIDFNFLATVARDDGRAPGIRLREGIDYIHTVLNRIERIEKPVVAKIHGFCGGLGLELALAADFRIASRGASLGLPEIILGLIPDCGGTTRLTRLLGPGWAKELIMTGDMIPATTRIKITIGNVAVAGELYDTPCARKIVAALPLSVHPHEWGDEFYFEIPVALPLDVTATTKVAVGDIGYWPPGKALAIFFGPTPASTGTEPVPASAVNIVGRVLGDASMLRSAKGASSIRIEKG